MTTAEVTTTVETQALPSLVATEGGGAFATTVQEATGFLGHSGFELTNLQGTLNTAETIGERMFTGHALDMMQARGFVPSVVENAIQTGASFPGNTAGTMGYFDVFNNLRVILNMDTGAVITVISGAP